MPGLPVCCDSSPSWICIAVFKPRRRKGRCSSEELAARISAICERFSFVKSAVLKATTSNHVAVFSVWEKGSAHIEEPSNNMKVPNTRNLLDHARIIITRHPRQYYPGQLPHVLLNSYEKAISAVARTIHSSWYEVSCWDSKEKLISSLPSKSSMQTQGHSLHDKRPPLPSHTPSLSSPSSSLPLSRCSSSSHATQCAAPCCHILVLGDIVHLRLITGRKSDMQDMLSYSCLAILKSYFQQTDGLNAYAFYRSLDSTRMVGMGIWQSLDAAQAFINVPNGPPEEAYWRSLGAKTKLGLFEVVSLATE